MNQTMMFCLFGMFACLMLSSFFSGFEAGILSINAARLMHWVRAGLKPAVRLHRHLSDMHHTLTTILVGNNLCNVLLSTLSAYVAANMFSGDGLLNAAWSAGVACVILYLGEYMPKLLFSTRPLRRTVLMCPLFSFVSKLLRPITAVIIFMTQWIIPAASGKKNDRFYFSIDYLENLISDKKSGADITPFERMMIRRVLAMHRQTARDVMKPLDEVVIATDELTVQGCCELARTSGHLRIPIFSQDRKICFGVMHVLDELTRPVFAGETLARRRARRPVFVYGDIPTDDILTLMRRNRSPLVVVRDELTNLPIGIVSEHELLRTLIDSSQ
jgi:CBS domain containing-hemolysin-like protein